MVILLPYSLPTAEPGTHTLAERKHESTGKRQACGSCAPRAGGETQGPYRPWFGASVEWPGPSLGGEAVAAGPASEQGPSAQPCGNTGQSCLETPLHYAVGAGVERGFLTLCWAQEAQVMSVKGLAEDEADKVRPLIY